MMNQLKNALIALALVVAHVPNAAADAVIGECRIATTKEYTIKDGDVYATPLNGTVCITTNAKPGNVSGAPTRQTSFVNAGYPENGVPSGPVNVTGYAPLLGTFPAKGKTGYVPLNKDQYVAMEFNTGALANKVFGEVNWTDPTTNKGIIEVAISKTPGDFNVSYLCKGQGGVGTVTWIINTNNGYACNLTPNTVYYLNARAVDCQFDTCNWHIYKTGRSN